MQGRGPVVAALPTDALGRTVAGLIRPSAFQIRRPLLTDRAKHPGRCLAKHMAVRVVDERPPEETDCRREARPAPVWTEPLPERQLRVAPQLVDLRYSVHAADRAQWRAPFLPMKFAPQVVLTVAFEGDARTAALLRTPVNETVFADVEVTATSRAMPVVRLPVRQVLLKPVVVRVVERRVAERDDLLEDASLRIIQRPQPAASVMNNADRGRESQGACPSGDRNCIFWIADPAADDGIDGDVEGSTAGKPAQLLIEHLETLLRNVVGDHVVDADLQVIESGAIQPRDAFLREEVAVGDERGDHPAAANTADDLVELRMEQGLAAAECHDARAQDGESIDAAENISRSDRLGMIVVFVAIGAGQVATAHRDQMRGNRAILRRKRPDQHARFT